MFESRLFEAVDRHGIPFSAACEAMTRACGGTDLAPFIICALGAGWSKRKVMAKIHEAIQEGCLPSWTFEAGWRLIERLA